MSKPPVPKYATAMLIDDSEVDNFINLKMIEASAFAEKTYVHTTAKSALEFLYNIQRTMDVPSTMPQIIFLDINMPLMDGFQFITEFEKLPDDLRKNTRIVMLTTSINPSDMERSSKSHSVSKFLIKPLTTEMLDLL